MAEGQVAMVVEAGANLFVAVVAGTPMAVKETEASRGGICYVTANGRKVRNLGEKRVKGLNDKGQNVGITIQMANIKKVLGSVSKMNDAGNTVIFSKGRSVVITDPESRLVHRMSQSVSEEDVT